MTCPHTSTCPIYPHFKLEAILQVWKLNYCDGAFAKCARFQLACDARPVPITLLPNGQHLKIPVATTGAA